MAAYASLMSLMNTMEQILNHPRLCTSLDKKQMDSLRENVGFLLDFIEIYNSRANSKEAEDLKSQIASAAHAAEDVIESHLVDQILGRSTGDHVESSSSFLLHLQKDIKKKVMKVQEKIQSKDDKSRLQKVVKDMDSIKKKIMKIERKGGFEDKQPTYSAIATSSRPLINGKYTMVGFEDESIKLLEWLTGTQSNRLIIPIVGMGGIGKTTLARNVYESSIIVHYFHVRAWVTVSQKYRVRDIIFELLSSQLNQENRVTDEQSQKAVHQLGEQLYKSLSGKRYLIILDDIWSIEAWDEIKSFFPDTNNGSRIVVTTRLSNEAIHFGSWCFKMNFLDENQSWKLFCEKAFIEESCPLELLEIGKKIVEKCRGLPLSIVVIGGLLRKFSKTREYWESVAKDINSILNSRKDEHCFNILSLSYIHLPPHLKPCFLYMGIFPEDSEIRVSRLIKLWVAEGFLKPNKAQSLEEVAEGYLNDLIERNLILVHTWRSYGKIKTCNIHDLLRDLCLRLAEKENFLCITRVLDTPRGMDRERRVVIHNSNPTKWSQSPVIHALRSTSVVRSLICKGAGELSFKFKLLRVLSMAYCDTDTRDGVFISDCLAGIFNQVNLQYLACGHLFISNFKLPSSISLLWNLQTLILRGSIKPIDAPSEIWELPQLRHLEFDEIYIPDPPPSNQQDGIVLENLQTLLKIVNFKWSENACKRIPNIKKLHIIYADFSAGSDCFCLYNIGNLRKLESLNCLFGKLPDRDDLLQNFTFPRSLKKLSLTKCQLHWEDLTMIGCLPHLEVLKLELGSVIGLEWNPVEGQFLCLKYLKIHYSDLMYWNVESSHFPVLESLVLDQLFKLDEIPSSIGEIPTLKVICLDYCKVSAAISAMNILEEQESLGNDGLQVRVEFWALTELERIREKQEEQTFTSNNFQLIVT